VHRLSRWLCQISESDLRKVLQDRVVYIQTHRIANNLHNVGLCPRQDDASLLERNKTNPAGLLQDPDQSLLIRHYDFQYSTLNPSTTGILKRILQLLLFVPFDYLSDRLSDQRYG
jgi:hypothetical protein